MPPKLLLQNDGEAIEAIMFSLRRVNADKVEVIRLRGKCTTQMYLNVKEIGKKVRAGAHTPEQTATGPHARADTHAHTNKDAHLLLIGAGW